MRAAAEWLVETGQPLWVAAEISDADVSRRAKAGELVLGFRGGHPVASMYLQAEDDLYWSDAADKNALYVHRLAVLRAEAGKGWSRLLLDWAASEVGRRGGNFVRLDSELRPRLLRLYEDCGYVRIDREPIRVGPHLVVRFERRIRTV